MKKIILALLLASSISACASIVDGRTQNVTILPSRGEEVEATVMSDGGTQTIKMPQTISLRKDSKDIVVNVKRTNCVQESSTVSKSRLNPWFWGNIIFGGLFGSTTDATLGGMWSYDDTVTVPVNEKDHCSK
jgi:hypothetical protein